jgi:hypothetical protein
VVVWEGFETESCRGYAYVGELSRQAQKAMLTAKKVFVVVNWLLI